MFQNLSSRLTGIFDRLRNRGALNEADVTTALREIRVALLEADVALSVVKTFLEEVKAKAIGQDVIRSISPGQLVVKIVHDHLVQMLGGEAEPLNLAGVPPVVFLMVGLQGSGKTTSSAKLGRWLKNKSNKKVLLASLDVYRPAAQEQLEILGQENELSTLPIIAGEKPDAITRRALDAAHKGGYDILILDTAGRLHIDETLMDEVSTVKSIARPLETLLVADAMTGQDAVTIAKAFQEKVGITGIILTRIDGDARGGAALSMRAITQCPIKFMGVGEKSDQLEVFQPERIAGRILDMGDVVSLVEKAAEMINQEDAEKAMAKMQQGKFDLNDMVMQMEQMLKMGGLGGIMSMLPGMGRIKDKIAESGVDDHLIRRQMAIVRSMTKRERRDPKVLNGSRRRRIAAGCGQTVADVNQLLKRFDQMQQVMKQMGKMGKTGLMRGAFGNLFGSPRSH